MFGQVGLGWSCTLVCLTEELGWTSIYLLMSLQEKLTQSQQKRLPKLLFPSLYFLLMLGNGIYRLTLQLLIFISIWNVEPPCHPYWMRLKWDAIMRRIREVSASESGTESPELSLQLQPSLAALSSSKGISKNFSRVFESQLKTPRLSAAYSSYPSPRVWLSYNPMTL